MKRVLSIFLCLLLVMAAAVPAGAAVFQLRHYEEDIYAGGILDLYAYPEGGKEPYSYQWMVALGLDGGMILLEDNDKYSGTQTNHLQLKTDVGTYTDWSEIPYVCRVTDGDGTQFDTSQIRVDIFPTEELFPALERWGYTLYEPTITNTTDLKTSDYKNYTASTFAGSNLQITLGSTPVEGRAVLVNSEVKLTRQLVITENGQTVRVDDHTSYTPYTVGKGAVTIQAKLLASIGGHNLGEYQVKTIRLDVAKPTATGTGTARSACSLLRYTYNESQKLAAIPQGATVEILGSSGSYYHVFYNNLTGYVGKSLLQAQEENYDPVIQDIQLKLTAPVVGQKPAATCQVLTGGCQLYPTDPVTWTDKTTGKSMGPNDTFQAGHSYGVSIWVAAKSGYKFRVDAAYQPDVGAILNGNLPCYVYKAYEQDPEEVVEVSFTFAKAAEQPEHSCSPVLVPRVEPTCTATGFEAYYHCSCGANYKDAQGTQPVDISRWGSLPGTDHRNSAWLSDGTEHYKSCLDCGAESLRGAHRGGTLTCTEWPRCEVCNLVYGSVAPDHKWGPGFDHKEAGGHAWICADCRAHSPLQPHTPGPEATQTEPQRCLDCGFILVPAATHTHSLTPVAMVEPTCVREGVKAHYACDGCSQLFADEKGSQPVEPGELALPVTGHQASESWQSDPIAHWKECEVCREAVTESWQEHSLQEGKCALCGYREGAQETPTQPAAPQPGEPGTEQPSLPGTSQPGSSQPGGAKKPAPDWKILVLVGIVSFGAAVTAAVLIMKKKR